MDKNQQHFWIWLAYAVTGALILVNVDGKYQIPVLLVIILGAMLVMQKYGGSFDDFVNTLKGAGSGNVNTN